MKQNYFLALTSAVLLWLAWPPIPYTSVLLLFALTPLLFAIENVIRSKGKKKSIYIFRLSFLTFLIWNTASIYWVFNSLNAVMPVWTAILISIIPFGLAALLMTSAFWFYYQMRRITSRLWSFTALVCFWIAYEYLHQSWDLAFPWMNLGNGFAQSHYLVQWYEFTGVYGGTYWILVSNILIFETYLSFKTLAKSSINENIAKNDSFLTNFSISGRLKPTLLLVRSTAHILIPIFISLIMYNRFTEKKNPANVVVVQPNIDPYAKWKSSSSLQVKQLIRLSDSIGQANTEYFIWPETAITDYADENNMQSSPNFLIVQQFLRKYRNGNVISGIESYQVYDSAKTSTARLDEKSGKYVDYFNSAVQIENSKKVQFYHKSKLVPGVEQTPFSSALGFLKPVFANFGGSTGGFGSQISPSIFNSQSGIAAAPVICYESIWGAYVADYILKGAQFIAIITNDAWWGNTSGKDQHLLYAKLRAIETRRWIARSANTGISAFINQRGDIVKQSSWWTATALKADINLNNDLTFYVKHGDYIALAGCCGSGIFGLMLVISIFRKPKNSA